MAKETPVNDPAKPSPATDLNVEQLTQRVEQLTHQINDLPEASNDQGALAKLQADLSAAREELKRR